ncbi:hypothetical protein [Rhodococcus zopfii]|uniref:hypothetical protein n=1 Tax=Rhodococcus zopfii TaxID=43772 RepID=UPI001114EB34|nr:hypothetical protein [Rhodococcus zopfii]
MSTRADTSDLAFAFASAPLPAVVGVGALALLGLLALGFALHQQPRLRALPLAAPDELRRGHRRHRGGRVLGAPLRAPRSRPSGGR